MPLLPLNPTDTFEAAGNLLGTAANAIGQLSVNQAPTQSGLGTRQSRVPNQRVAITTRKMMRWLVPEQPIVEMYVNPQSVQYQYGKHITEQRTKGGFVLQYWGENITSLNIQGTTGTSGIEGINVLYDIYRNEQLMFDPYALFLQARRDEEDELSLPLEDEGFFGFLSDVGDLLGGGDSGLPATTRPRPSLASLAFTVELYWSGEVYRGYFKDFQVTESANNLGLFDYSISFRVTQRRGFRQNFLPWHRSATSGPSNSNPIYGTPYSYGVLSSGPITSGGKNVDQPNLFSNFVEPFQKGLNAIDGLPGVVSRGTSNLLNAFDV